MSKVDKLSKAGVWPRVLNAELAALYLSVSRSQFYRLVEQGVYPKPFQNGGLVQWDRFDLDDAIEALKAGRLTPQEMATHDSDPILEEIRAWTPSASLKRKSASNPHIPSPAAPKAPEVVEAATPVPAKARDAGSSKVSVVISLSDHRSEE